MPQYLKPETEGATGSVSAIGSSHKIRMAASRNKKGGKKGGKLIGKRGKGGKGGRSAGLGGKGKRR